MANRDFRADAGQDRVHARVQSEPDKTTIGAGARAPMAVWIYVNTSKQICDKDHIKLFATPVGRSKSPGYGHVKLPHLMIAVSAAEQQ
ncbi:hypothetical protein ABIF65_009489 [Bradyrhizobium japonicum]